MERACARVTRHRSFSGAALSALCIGVLSCSSAQSTVCDKAAGEMACAPDSTVAVSPNKEPAPSASVAPSSSSAATATGEAPDAPKVAHETVPTDPTKGPSAGSKPVGIAACDEYLRKMDACLSKTDPAARAATETSFKQTGDAWRAAAASGNATRDALATGCQAALDAIPPFCK